MIRQHLTSPVWICMAGLFSILGTETATAQRQFYVQGYPETWSNVSGQEATFYLTGEDNPAAPITIYDHVHNQPMGTVTIPLSRQEVAPTNTESWMNGYDWDPVTIQLPELPSGLYSLSGPTRNERGVSFLVTEPDKQADIVVLYPTNTLNAYNSTPNFHDHPNWPEQVNLYSRGEDSARPDAVSFHRPTINNMYLSRRFDSMLLSERAGTFKYVSDADLEDYSSIAGAKMVIIPSHSEYWTVNARRNFDRFVESGGSALLLAGNMMYRVIEYDDPTEPTQVRFKPRIRFTSPHVGYPVWESLGADFLNGGYAYEFEKLRDRIQNPFQGYKLLDTSPTYFDGTGLSEGEILNIPAKEYDGVPFVSIDQETGPVVDHELLGFHRMDVIAFENTWVEGRPTAGTWIDFQKTPDSGRVINVGEAHWTLFQGESGPIRKVLTRNMIDVLLIAQADFTEDDMLAADDIDLLMAASHSPEPRLRFDLTEDRRVDRDDTDRWLRDFADTWYGDADLNGEVDLADFLTLSKSFGGPGGWSDGDFDGNRVVNFDDFLLLAAGIDHDGSPVDLPDLNEDCNTDNFVDILDANCMDNSMLDDFLISHGTIRGDLDGRDGVDFDDFLTLKRNMGQKDADYTDGDINQDGVVEFADFLVLSSNYGLGNDFAYQQTAIAVPEANAKLSLLLGLILIASLRRRRLHTT